MEYDFHQRETPVDVDDWIGDNHEITNAVFLRELCWCCGQGKFPPLKSLFVVVVLVDLG